MKVNILTYIDFEDTNIADKVIRAIEKDYGRSIVKIPKFERKTPHVFTLTIVFSDFTILEAEIKIVNTGFDPTIIIQGSYY